MQEEKQEMDELDLQVEKRRQVYQYELYAKVRRCDRPRLFRQHRPVFRPLGPRYPLTPRSTLQATQVQDSDRTRRRGRLQIIKS